MALGAITKVSGADTTFGNKKIRVRDIVLGTGANYPTGGETILPSAVGLFKRIEQAQATGIARATSGGATSRSVSFDFATLASTGAVKMQVHTTASAEAANNSDQSAFSIRVMFIGY